MKLTVTKKHPRTNEVFAANDGRYFWNSTNEPDAVWDDSEKRMVSLFRVPEFESALNALRVVPAQPAAIRTIRRPCPRCGTYCDGDCGR